jgi:8-oxo-dGTP diphosphatase
MNQKEVKFCIRCGTPVEARKIAGELRPGCPSCGWIYFPDPKVAAAALVEKEDKVLLIRRVMTPHQGKWSLPAGFVDAHEDPARAAERECLEETGLTVHTTKLLKILSGREHPNGADIVLIYKAEITGGILLAGDDADRAAFFSRDKLPPLAFKATIETLSQH